MIENFIGGGQVFMHKTRMFWQVFKKTLSIALILGLIGSWLICKDELEALDWAASISYRKAVFSTYFNEIKQDLRKNIGKENNHITLIEAKTKYGSWGKMDPQKILKLEIFQKANQHSLNVLAEFFLILIILLLMIFTIVFSVWSMLGKKLKKETVKEGSSKILTDIQVRKILRTNNIASDLYIGKMPLVKDSETQHIIVTGSTGSGKTNFMHHLLPQINNRGDSVVVMDQTGEMIAKYFDATRGDIIFNPFDSRSNIWDFWDDCASTRHLEKFVDTVIGFNSKKNHSNSDSFWEESAKTIFVEAAKYLIRQDQKSILSLRRLITRTDPNILAKLLKDTEASKYFTKENDRTLNSILSVLVTNAKPMRYLRESGQNSKFSIKNYIENIGTEKSWLFLSTEPSTRELTIPLIACLVELIVARLMSTNLNTGNKLWFVFDELAALGNLPSLSKLMSEGRKYGACILAGTQSISQLHEHYGQYGASNIFGLFRTKFAFQSDDPIMAKTYGQLCGGKIVTRQQKNTSFGAHEYRDGVSYNEKQDNELLVKYEDLSKLGIGECFGILPIPQARISKISLEEAKITNKNPGFVEACDLEYDIEKHEKNLEDKKELAFEFAN